MGGITGFAFHQFGGLEVVTAVVTTEVEGLAVAEVVEEGVELTAIIQEAELAAGAEGLVIVEKATILVVETRI